MKSTRLKISVGQDGLLPQETAEVAMLDFPILPKKLLKALGFERVDATTYVGVLPVFVNLANNEQEIEIELGITIPEMRKKVIEIVKNSAKNSSPVVETPAKPQKEKAIPAAPAKKTQSKKAQTQKARR